MISWQLQRYLLYILVDIPIPPKIYFEQHQEKAKPRETGRRKATGPKIQYRFR
jgi:hypothetical protein